MAERYTDARGSIAPFGSTLAVGKQGDQEFLLNGMHWRQGDAYLMKLGVVPYEPVPTKDDIKRDVHQKVQDEIAMYSLEKRVTTIEMFLTGQLNEEQRKLALRYMAHKTKLMMQEAKIIADVDKDVIKSADEVSLTTPEDVTEEEISALDVVLTTKE